MKATLFFVFPAALLLSLAGCSGGKPEAPKETAATTAAKKTPADPEAKIKENIAKLPKEEQAIAEAQKFCAVETDNRLGTMGMPYKVTIDEQPVFLCCKGCEKTALKNPKILEEVKKLKEKTKAEATKNKEKAKDESAK
jgi:hypothetical protein